MLPAATAGEQWVHSVLFLVHPAVLTGNRIFSGFTKREFGSGWVSVRHSGIR